MMRFLRTKFLPILVALTLILFLTNDFGLIDIEKTAIIIAVGIDKSQNSEEYEVTAQIAVPQATNTTKNNEEALVTGKGKTIADAVDDIAVRTGWYPMLSFCNLVVLGDGVLSGNVMTFLDVFVRTDKIPDSSLLVACEGEAKEILEATTPLDSISSFAIEKILIKDIAKLNRISFINVKDFTKGFFSKSKSSFMPYIKRVTSKNTQIDEGDSASNAENGGSSGSSQKSGEKQKVLFDCTETLIFKDGVNVGKLNSYETLTFNLRKYTSIDTFYDMEKVEINGTLSAATIGLNETKKSFSLKFDGTPVFKIDLHFNCQLEDVNQSEPVENLFTTQIIPEKTLRDIENKIVEYYEIAFKKMQDSNCDLYGLADELYKFHYSHYDEYKDDILHRTKLDVSVKCKTERNTKA